MNRIAALMLVVVLFAYLMTGCSPSNGNISTNSTGETPETLHEESSIQITADFNVDRVCYILNDTQSGFQAVTNFTMNGHYDFDEAVFVGDICVERYPITKDPATVVFSGAVGCNSIVITNKSRDPRNPAGETVYDVDISIKDRDNILIYIQHNGEYYIGICGDSAEEAWYNFEQYHELRE